MTSLSLRIDPGHPESLADVAVDWFLAGDESSDVGYKPSFLQGLTTSVIGMDLLRLGALVFMADKLVLRGDPANGDGWTRSISISLPVSDRDRWNAARGILQHLLAFLSGDRWTVEFEPLREATVPPRRRRRSALAVPLSEVSHVCLFSGGLDSLAGAVDLLEDGAKPILLGHYESGLTSRFQKNLSDKLEAHYGPGRCDLRQLYLSPKRGSMRLPTARERTTRARSFLFLAAAMAAAEAVGPQVPVVMPENGFIGINVPLSRSRAGSLSTRTTHPRYVAYFHELMRALGLGHRIENPFRLQTKGEVLASSGNPDLLGRLTRDSVSCAHAEAARWGADPQGNCGACYPCLIRGAAIHKVGWDPGTVRFDPLEAGDQALLLAPRSQTGASLRALRTHLRRPLDPYAAVRNGSIPAGEASNFQALYERGRAELAAWLGSGPTPVV